MKEDDFEMEMKGGSEDHEYAMDLIRNLVKVSKEQGRFAGISKDWQRCANICEDGQR